ncbi:MAG: TraB/GumN family protein [Myxococcales bacterium]|nr:TraB/GumN family protein [Myxococcales bacterium]
MRTLASRTVTLAVAALVATVACKSDPRPPATPPPTTPTQAAPDPWGGTAAPAAPTALVQPLVWEATKDGHTLSLLGTIHVGVDALTELPPWVLARLDAAPAFAMETDLSDPGVVKLMVRTDGKTLADELGPTDWQRLRAALGESLAEGMNSMKPFAALSALSLKDLPMTAPMDMVLFQRARDANKRLVFLETVAAQLAAIDPFATAADIKALLDHAAEAKADTQKMVGDYRAGDAAGSARCSTTRPCGSRPAATRPGSATSWRRRSAGATGRGWRR